MGWNNINAMRPTYLSVSQSTLTWDWIPGSGGDNLATNSLQHNTAAWRRSVTDRSNTRAWGLCSNYGGRLHLKCDGTCAETRFRLSAKLTSPFKSAEGRQFSRLLAGEVCVSAVVMLDTPSSEVVWRVLGTHPIRQFPLHFPSRASPCAITFQLDSTPPNNNIFTRWTYLPFLSGVRKIDPRTHVNGKSS
jgi:hypothetical protein